MAKIKKKRLIKKPAKRKTTPRQNAGHTLSLPARVPSVLVELGLAVEIHVETKTENVYYEFSRKNHFVLASDVKGKRLFIFSKTGSSPQRYTEQTHAIYKGEQLREAFTGFEVDKIENVSYKNTSLTHSGKCLHVVYDSNKWGRTIKRYIHTFRVSPLVKVDNIEAPSFVVISGGDIRITERGIIG